MPTTGTRGRVGRPRKNIETPIPADVIGTKLPMCEGETVEMPWLNKSCKPHFYMLKAKLREKGIDRNEFSVSLNRWANTLGEYIQIKEEASKTPYVVPGHGGQVKIHPLHTLLTRKAQELDGCCRMFGFTPDTLNKLVVPKTHFEVGDNDFEGF